MKTKAQIVGELLKDGKINAEDAVVLLTPEYVNYNQYPSWNPPYYYQTNPFIISCDDPVTGTTITNLSNAAFTTITDN